MNFDIKKIIINFDKIKIMKNKEILEEIKSIKERLEILQKEIEKDYPIYCKLKGFPLVIKFIGLHEGEVVVNSSCWDCGDKSSDWTSHTDTDNWQQLEVCPDTGFFDGQAVWCWDDVDTHEVRIRFYDAKNNCAFDDKGRRNGFCFENIAPFEGNYTEWMLKAFNTLKY